MDFMFHRTAVKGGLDTGSSSRSSSARFVDNCVFFGVVFGGRGPRTPVPNGIASLDRGCGSRSLL